MPWTVVYNTKGSNLLIGAYSGFKSRKDADDFVEDTMSEAYSIIYPEYPVKRSEKWIVDDLGTQT